MIRRSSLLTGILALAGAAVILTGCGGGTTPPTPTPTVTTGTPSGAPSPTPTPTPSQSTVSYPIPKDCASVGTSLSRADTVDQMTLQSDGQGFVRPAPTGATLALGCDWIVGDSTGILLLISTASPANVTSAVDQLPGQGYTCQVSDDFGAKYCVQPGTGPDSENTVVARDNVWVYLESHNVNARALLSDLATQIFG